MSNVQNEVGSLSAAEKFDLLDAPWKSLEADVPAPTDEQRAELDYRIALYERNPSDVIPWEQVRASLRNNRALAGDPWLHQNDHLHTGRTYLSPPEELIRERPWEDDVL